MGSGDVQVSVSTGSLTFYPLRSAFARVKQAGFESVELVVSWEVALWGASYVQALMAEFEVSISAVHPPLLRLPGWHEDEATLLRLIDLAEAVEASIVVWHPPRTEHLSSGSGPDFLQALESARIRLESSPVQIALENPAIYTASGWRYALARQEDLRRFVDTHDLGLTFDTVHAGGAGQGVLESYEMLRSRIVHVHLSDLRRLRRPLPFPPLQMHLEHHQMTGTGRLPLAHFLGRLRRDGYEGAVALEVSPLALGIWWPPFVTARLRACLEFMQRALGGGHVWEPVRPRRRPGVGVASGG